VLSERPASQQGASSAERSGRVSIVYVLSRAVFQFGLRHHFQTPRARVVARLKGSLPILMSAYA